LNKFSLAFDNQEEFHTLLPEKNVVIESQSQDNTKNLFFNRITMYSPPGMLPKHASFNREQLLDSLFFVFLVCCVKLPPKNKCEGNLQQFYGTTETNLIPLH
jgi:hypothetical protein